MVTPGHLERFASMYSSMQGTFDLEAQPISSGQCSGTLSDTSQAIETSAGHEIANALPRLHPHFHPRTRRLITPLDSWNPEGH